MAARQGVPTLGGYGYEFLSPVHDKWLCLICHLPLKDPVQIVGCGHRLCGVCMDEVLRRPEPACPADRKPITRDQVFPDVGCKMDVLDLHIKCPNEGCTWTGELRAVESEDHLNECILMVVPCEFTKMGCDAKFQRCQMEQHMDSALKRHLELTCRKLQRQEEEFTKKLEATEKDIVKLMRRFDLETKNESFKWKLNTTSSHYLEDSIDSFYLHGYRMGIALYSSQVTNVTIKVKLGRYDDELEWPMRRKVCVDFYNSSGEFQDKMSVSFYPNDAFSRPGPNDIREFKIKSPVIAEAISRGSLVLRFD